MKMKRETLLTVVRMLNATKDSAGTNVATKVTMKGVVVEELKREFLAACESVSVENERLLPDQVCDVYNLLVEEFKEKQKTDSRGEQAPKTIPEEKGGKDEQVVPPQSEKATVPGKQNSLLREYLSFLIASSEYDAKTIIEKTLQKFPGKTKGAISTYISDGKNPKYNKFAKLIVVNEEGKLTFAS